MIQALEEIDAPLHARSNRTKFGFWLAESKVEFMEGMVGDEELEEPRTPVSSKDVLPGCLLIGAFLAYVAAIALFRGHWFVDCVLIGPYFICFGVWLFLFGVVSISLDDWIKRIRSRRVLKSLRP